MRRELARKFLPEPGRSAGDESGAAVEKIHGARVSRDALRVTSGKKYAVSSGQ
jgi:hypothetical protein